MTGAPATLLMFMLLPEAVSRNHGVGVPKSLAVRYLQAVNLLGYRWIERQSVSAAEPAVSQVEERLDDLQSHERRSCDVPARRLHDSQPS